MADTTPVLPASAADRMLDTLDGIIKNATSPDVFEAQTILLRRLALQGDVIGSRIPAPRNISEIGGYLNLLDTLDQPEMRAQALAGILGVAGPNPPLGWLTSKPPLAFLTFNNDRPDVPSQPAIPLTFSIRSDFADALKAGLQTLHDQGCTLPLLSSVPPLPQAMPGLQPPDDALPYLGRTLSVVPGTALRDPATDPLALARAQGTADPFALVSRSISAGTVAVPGANWDVLQCDNTQCTPVAVNGGKFVPVAPVMATVGFYAPSPLPQPGNLLVTDWARFNNITGLVAGVTRLGDELSQVYNAADIAASVFATRLHWVWDGVKFSHP
ncbi:MAG TPA: hypothetical protein VLT16_11505 [Candidatus Limnocylindrales bacterium]|nr:hypothetical protein [Candidatus Limnocylindrales bacterium]